MAFVQKSSNMLLDYALKKKNVSVDYGIPKRDWLKGSTEVRDGQTIPVTTVYRFFCNPDLDNANEWAKVDEVDTSFAAFVGIDDRLDNDIRHIPIDTPEPTMFDDGTWSQPFPNDPILNILKSTSKFDKGKERVLPKSVTLTSYVNEEGEVRILEFSRSMYTDFLTRIEDLVAEDPDFDITGKPIRLTKVGSGITAKLQIRFAKDEPVFDMSKYTPVDIGEYVTEVRHLIDEWVAARSNGNAPADSTPPFVEEEVVIESTGDARADLAVLQDDELRAMCEEAGIELAEKATRKTMTDLLLAHKKAD